MMKKATLLGVLALILVVGGVMTADSWAQQAKPPDQQQADPEKKQTRRIPLKIEGQSVLPLRVLVRPFSHIYKQADVKSGTVQENVPAFTSFYVYSKPEAQAGATDVTGFYEVGTDNRGTVLGWMRAEDVLEWKQTMCLAYTHPQGRQPVLMFDQKAFVEALVKEPAEKRAEQVKALYAAIDAGKIPADFPVRSVEPKKAVDISEQFYLLPILEFTPIEMEGREGRILRLAAATGASPQARQSSDIRENQGYREAATEGATQVEAGTVQDLTVDVLFVMDTTISMQPYIDATLSAIRDMTRLATEDPDVAKKLRFGLMAYRDSATDIPKLEYLVKNFTPDLLPVDKFEQVLATVKAAPVGSKDYNEDVFSGIDKGIHETKWGPNSLRFIILVGDAPSHQPGHPWNFSGQSASTLRSIADDKKVYILAMHIKDPEAARFHELTETQFKTLSRNRGLEGESSYWSVSSKDVAAFQAAAKAVAETLAATLKEAKQMASASAAPAAPAAPPTSEAAPTAPAAPAAPAASAGQPDPAALAKRMGRAALVEWIGKASGAQAPRDIIAWAVDKDLLDPAVQSMDVRLLINKRQLDSLRSILKQILEAGRRGQIGGEDFFTALQATAATTARNPDQIRNAKSMGETGLVPSFLKGLPYKSRIMAMDNQLWSSWSPDEQDEFLNEVEAKIQAYSAIHDNPQGWIQLNKGDDPDENVYPIRLELLP